MWWIIASLAFADEPPETVELGGDAEALPSALDGFDGKAEEVRADGTVDLPMVEGMARVPSLLRGRWVVRPVTSVAWLAAPQTDRTWWAGRIGLSVGRQWWWLQDGPVQLGGDVGVLALFPVGGTRGRRFEITGQLGPWFGPIGVRIGPTVRSDRAAWQRADALLQDTLLVGVRTSVAADLGPVSPVVGVEPGWLVLGERPPASPDLATLPVLGHETAWLAGLTVQAQMLSIGVLGTWRETAVGAEIDATLTLGLALF